MDVDVAIICPTRCAIPVLEAERRRRYRSPNARREVLRQRAIAGGLGIDTASHRRVAVCSSTITDQAWEQKSTLRWYDVKTHGWRLIIAGDSARREIRDLPRDAKREYSARLCSRCTRCASGFTRPVDESGG